jgi:hypothetical protein
MKPRARRVVLIVVAAALLGAIIAGAGGWYLLGEERRTGRIVAGVLSGRLGVPVTVERAGTRGTNLWLRGVRVPAGGGSAVDIGIDELDIEGGVLPLVVPAGRRLTIVAASTSVTLRDGDESPSPTAAMEALRNAAAALLAWPGALSLRVDGGQLTRAGHTFALELTAEKTSNGLTVTLGLLDAGTKALRLTTRSAGSADGVVTTHVDFSAVPSQLAGVWPVSLPTAAALAGSGEVRLARGGNMTTTARLSAGAAAGAPVIELTSRWDPARTELVVSRYALDWGRDLHLEGAATLPADGRPLSASAEGTIDGSAVRGRAGYGISDGQFNGEVTLVPFSARKLAQRLGTALSTEIAARTLVVRFTGTARGGRPVSVDFTGQAVTTPALTRIPLDVAGAATIELASDRTAAVGLNASTLTLSRDGRTIGQMTAASRRGGLWPIEVRGTVDDAAGLAPLLPMPVRLTGRATVDGEIASASPPVFRGTVQAQLSEVDLTAGGHVTFTGIKATVPIGFGIEAPPAGTVTSERVTAYGFTATGVTSSARLNAGRLLLPDIRYNHYGGQGDGWLEVAVDGRPTPMRARLEGTRVDLAALVRDVGTSAGQITGHVHYVLTVQDTTDKGLAAVMQFASDGGGEVSIEPIQRLLDSATVQAETTGVLQQTLQNLRVFNYESLEGALTWNQGAGHIDLSLKGKKRLGIFPGPVDAINFRNVPLTVLARTLSRGAVP